MSIITWTRHEFTPIADATERKAWYRAAGLDGWFDITNGSSAGVDFFTLQPYTDGAKVEFEWQYMQGATNREKMNTCRSIFHYNIRWNYKAHSIFRSRKFVI